MGETQHDVTIAALGAVERNLNGILGLTSLAAPQLALATFAASSIIKFIRLGREVQFMTRTRQRELVQKVRELITPTLLTTPDPDLVARMEVTNFFIFAGEVNPELQSARFQELYDAFKSQIDIFVGGDHTDPLYRSSLNDLSFVYHYIRPAHEEGLFDNKVLQGLFGHMLGQVQGYRAILSSARNMRLSEYEHTPDWYSENLNDYIYWQLMYRFVGKLQDEAREKLEESLNKEIRTKIIEVLFGDGGIFDNAIKSIGDYETAKKEAAVSKVNKKITELTRSKEDLDEANRQTLDDISNNIRELAYKIEDLEDGEEKTRLENEKRDSERQKRRLQDTISQEKSSIDRKIQLLEREKENLE